MKYILYFLMAILLLSCKKDSIPYNNEFKKSTDAWNTYKVSVNNSYSYVAYSGSVFGGYSETKITVQNGVVVGRAYLMGIYPPNSQTLQVKTTWTEDKATLNSHAEGALSITLDEIYAKAQSEWLSADKTKNDIYFTVDNNGLISSCGYVPKGCMDDCFLGINIKAIAGL